ncbi:hypothetical protein M8C21_004085, partial [Ambrosia artemisiifolia]
MEIKDDDENIISQHEAEYEDVFTVSMMKLYSAQDAFQIELQKLKDVGKEDHEIKTRLNQNITVGDLKMELDELMKQKLEVEVQHIAISKAIKHWKVRAELMEEQKKVLSEQMEMMKKVEDAESKAIELRMQAEKLQVTCEEILDKEQVWEARNM